MTQGLQPARRRLARAAVLAACAAMAVVVMETHGVGQTSGPATPAAPADVRFMTLDPGHFHAALVQKEMYPGVSPQVDVYAPLGPDLLGHLARVSAYNLRPASPTAWRLDVHTGPDYLARMLREKPGNVVVLSGRNAGKIERVGASVEAGLNVLVDKPWILALGRPAEADPRARGGGRPQAGRLRHHDRALRGLERAAARAGHGRGGVRRDGPGHAGRARRLHRERAPPDEGRLGRAEHPARPGSSTSRSRARASTTSARTWSTSCSGRCCPIAPSTPGPTSRCSTPTAGRR